jgi:hypothetical protein
MAGYNEAVEDGDFISQTYRSGARLMASETVMIRCPHCHADLKAPVNGYERTLQCSVCQKNLFWNDAVELVDMVQAKEALGLELRKRFAEKQEVRIATEKERAKHRAKQAVEKEETRIATEQSQAKRRATRSAEKEAKRHFRHEVALLAKSRMLVAIRAFATSAIFPLVLLGIVCLLAQFGKSVPGGRDRLLTILKWGGGISLVCGLCGLVAHWPWFIFSKKAAANAIAKAMEERRLAQIKVAEEQRLVEEKTQKEIIQEQARIAQIEASRKAKEEWAALAADGGNPACWTNKGWWDFEIAVLLAFEHHGYTAAATPPSKDGGLDGNLGNHEGDHGVQCKHLRQKDFVKVAEIRDFIGALTAKGLTSGFFVTTGQYSEACIQTKDEVAQRGITLRLVTTKDLARMGTGLTLTLDTIAKAKERWGVPQEPPADMPQGPRQRRNYGRRNRWRRRWY